ncbi:MAG: HAD family hydrolase [Spirochaetales bacterium]
MEQQIRAVLFDLDGTLVDSIADISAATNRALSRFDVEPLDEDSVRSMVGWGLPELARRVVAYLGKYRRELHLSNEQFTEVLIEEYDRVPFEHTRVYAGIRELLDTLAKSGIPSAVCTNKREQVAEAVVRGLFDPGTFVVVVGQRSDRPPKPDFAAVKACLDALGVSATNAVFVGDSDVDIQTAHNAGMPAIGAAWGFRDREHLHAAGADVVFDTPADVRDYFYRTAARPANTTNQ